MAENTATPYDSFFKCHFGNTKIISPFRGSIRDQKW